MSKLLTVVFGRADAAAQKGYLAKGALLLPEPQPRPEPFDELVLHVETVEGPAVEVQARIIQILEGRGIAVSFDDLPRAKPKVAAALDAIAGSNDDAPTQVYWGRRAPAPRRRVAPPPPPPSRRPTPVPARRPTPPPAATATAPPPSRKPTKRPTKKPTNRPTARPSMRPTKRPSKKPLVYEALDDIPYAGPPSDRGDTPPPRLAITPPSSHKMRAAPRVVKKGEAAPAQARGPNDRLHALVARNGSATLDELEDAAGFRRADVLVVEDDAALRETMCAVLEDAGYRVVTTSDGEDALRFLESTAELPRLILLDLMMPRMDGWRFREKQKADPRLARICTAVITGDTTRPVPVEHRVTKPITLDGLLDLVKRCVGKTTAA